MRISSKSLLMSLQDQFSFLHVSLKKKLLQFKAWWHTPATPTSSRGRRTKSSEPASFICLTSSRPAQALWGHLWENSLFNSWDKQGEQWPRTWELQGTWEKLSSGRGRVPHSTGEGIRMILVADGHCIHWSRRRKMFVVNTEKAEMNCESQIVNDENDICLSTIRKPRGHRTLQTPTVMKSKPCFGNGVLPQRTKCWHFQGKWTKPDVWKRGKGADSKGRVPCTFSHVGKSGKREK